MRPLPLFLVLALFAVRARAQEAPAPEDPAPAAAPAPVEGRRAMLAEIDSWRQGQLVHVTPPDPVTAEFEPRLDAIVAQVSLAQSPDDLTGPEKDFRTWQNELLIKKYAVTKKEGVTRGSLDDYSRVQRDLMKTFTTQADSVFQARLKQSSLATAGQAGRFFDGGGAAGAVVGEGANGRAPSPSSGASGTAPGLHINPAPLPPPTSKPMSLAALEDYFDHSGISDAVVKSVEQIKNEVAGFGHLLSGFAGSCYYGVKWMLIKTHVLPPEVQAPEEIGKIGIGSGNAYMMSQALKHNPKLQNELRVRALDLTTVKDGDAPRIPERTMFVFDRGCAGFSDESGHIELSLLAGKIDDLPASAFHRAGRRGGLSKPTVASNEILACSDGCFVHTMAYLRTYGRKGCLNAYVPVTAAPVQTASYIIPAAGR